MNRSFFLLIFLSFSLTPMINFGQYWAPKTITEIETQYFNPYLRPTDQFKASIIVRATSPSTTKPFVFVLRFYEEGVEMGTNAAEEYSNRYFVLRHLPMSDFDYWHSLLSNKKKRRVRIIYRKLDSPEHDFLQVVVTRNRKIDQAFPHDDFPDD